METTTDDSTQQATKNNSSEGPPDHDSASESMEASEDDVDDKENLALHLSFLEDDALTFARDGFVVYHGVLDKTVVEELNDHLEEILRGRYDRGQKPDKTPRLIRSQIRKSSNESEKLKNALGFSGNLQNVKVIQVINVHKSDSLFRKLAISPQLGKVVASLAGWKHGARLAQDQIWAKPPGAAPLVFHRDSPYFMFTPSDVVTVWVALDDMDEEIGPLEYVKGSHRWGDGRVGSANQFFQADGGLALLRSAAEREGIDFSDVDIVTMSGLKAGGISIHDGRTWHGSKKNDSCNRPRRGLGLHFVPAEVRFTEDASKSSLWRPYYNDVSNAKSSSEADLPEEDFPVTWRPQESSNHM